MTETLTARQELEEIALNYYEADVSEKAASKTKDALKPAFMSLLNEVIETDVPLAKLSVEVNYVELPEADDADESLEKWRLMQYPEYKIVRYVVSGTQFFIDLEEDATVRKYQFEANGLAFGRTIAMTGASYDAEGLHTFLSTMKSEGITSEHRKALNACIQTSTVIQYAMDDKKARKLLADFPELLPLLQRFNNPGQPQVRLLPIRPVKDEL